MSDKIRWGIIGTGKIAKAFAVDLAVLPDAELVAIGSRSIESANRFADTFDVPHRYASYQALTNAPDIDVVYIATPHALHKENSLLCLEAGKAVLCEKPLTINATEAESIINYARAKKLFLMEAMWTRYIPLIVKLRELLAKDVIGEVQILVAGLGKVEPFNPEYYVFDPHLGGGILLDAGVYPVSLASMVFGPPVKITGIAHLSKTGVDEQAAIILGYDQGQLATLYMSLKTNIPPGMTLMGSKGRIRIHPPIFNPTQLTLSLTGQDDEIIEMPFRGNGLNYEAIEVMHCLRAGKLESDIMPLDETLTTMRTLDQIRAQWGLTYPME